LRHEYFFGKIFFFHSVQCARKLFLMQIGKHSSCLGICQISYWGFFMICHRSMVRAANFLQYTNKKHFLICRMLQSCEVLRYRKYPRGLKVLQMSLENKPYKYTIHLNLNWNQISAASDPYYSQNSAQMYCSSSWTEVIISILKFSQSSHVSRLEVRYAETPFSSTTTSFSMVVLIKVN
jgi:hypothetical protein